jgi:hypothetical protein
MCQRFDVTENLKNFTKFLGTKRALTAGCMDHGGASFDRASLHFFIVAAAAVQLRPGLDANFFCKMVTVTFSLLFGKYCPIMV